MKKLLFAGCIAMMVVSCKTSKTTSTEDATATATSSINILGSSWELDKAGDSTSKKPTLVIEDKNISGNGGCNNFTGYLELDPATKSFKASKIASTRMACRGTNEPNYFKMLEEVTSYKIKGGQLHLYKGNLLLMKFNKK